MNDKDKVQASDTADNTTAEQETIIGTKAAEIISEVAEATDVSGDTQIVDIAQIKAKLAKNTSEAEAEETEEEFVDESQLNLFDEEDDFSPMIPSELSDTSVDETDSPQSSETVSDESEPVKEEVKEKKKIHFEIKPIPAKVKKGIIIGTSVVAVGVLAAYIACISTLQTEKIAKNVYIEGLNVGGMTYEEALESITSTTLFKGQLITLSHGSNKFEIDGAEIGLVASPEETAQKAFDYGKTGNKFYDGLLSLGLLFHRHTIVPVANVDTAKLDEQIWQFGVKCYGELIQHNIVVQADGLTYIGPGHTGFDNNTEPARNEILAALDNERFSNIPVTLTSCPPSEISIEQFDGTVYCDPIDAYYKYGDNTVEIIEAVPGRYINKEEAAPMLKTVVEGGEPVYIPWYQSEPAITAQMLQEKLFAVSLGSFSTYYGGTANRNANVQRAASLLNGAIIPPGETLSFNDRVGPRSVANGFYTAPEYVNGETVQGIGGGTCQVSTTLYGAVLYAGMDIVSRTNHMFAVSYAPLGQDATVAYGSVDFKFKNSSDYPVKVSAYTKGGTITVSILGTQWEPAKTIKLSHSVSHGTGTTVYSKRMFYQDGQLVKTETLPTSYYKPH